MSLATVTTTAGAISTATTTAATTTTTGGATTVTTTTVGSNGGKANDTDSGGGSKPENGLSDNFNLVREVGNQATWSLSSCKPGYGVEQLRDDNVETYWQSDGQLPHLVNIQFRRKTTVSSVEVYSDYKLDESYTPSKISVRCGTNFNDLQEIEVVDLSEPSGWIEIPLKDLSERPVRSFMVQIAIIANHQQGRDTHLRQIRINSPLEEKPLSTAEFASWSTPECLQFVSLK